MMYAVLLSYIALMALIAIRERCVVNHCNGRLGHRIVLKQKWILIILVVIATILCSVRNIENTADTAAYIGVYNRLNISDISAFFDLGNEFEIGFEFISKIIKIFVGDNYSLYLGINAFIILALSGYAIWHLTKRRISAFMLFYTTAGFYYSFIVIRQGIAIGIILLTLSKIVRNRKLYGLKFLIGVCIASLFHRTALICLLMLPFLSGNVSFNKVALIILFLICFALSYSHYALEWIAKIMLFFSNVFPTSGFVLRVEAYFTNITPTLNKNLVLLAVFLFIILFTNHRKFSTYNSRVMMSLECIGMAILSVFSGLGIATRMADYFLIAQCLLLPESTHIIGKKLNMLLILCYAIFRFYIFVNLTL